MLLLGHSFKADHMHFMIVAQPVHEVRTRHSDTHDCDLQYFN
jgi:hypothetical protein